MTEARLRSLFSDWQARLGLDDWTINVLISMPETDSAAMECRRSSQYERATIVVAPSMIEWEEPEDWLGPEIDDFFIEKSIIHELLHCHLRDIRYIEELYEDQLHRDVQSVVETAYARAEEKLVDKLAVALLRAWTYDG